MAVADASPFLCRRSLTISLCHAVLLDLLCCSASAAGATPVAITPANVQLSGVNAGFQSALGLFVEVNPSGSWLPPLLPRWVNHTDPYNSARLTELISGLGLGSYRYGLGGWNFSSDSLSPLANDSYSSTIAKIEAVGFPPRVFGLDRFDAMLQRSGGAETVILLGLNYGVPERDVPGRIVQQLGHARASKFEIGNEVYDPLEGPRDGGYKTAQDYLEDTRELIKAVRAAGGKAGVTVAPCPFFFATPDNGMPKGSECWGGPNGRYHQWQRNLSAACTSAPGGACPFDAVIAHAYQISIMSFAAYKPNEYLPVFLAVPQASIDFAAASMARDFPGAKLWITEYNAFYPDVWYGKSDKSAHDAAAFLNSTANSPAHAVFVAAHVIAAMGHGALIEVMHFLALLEGAGPTSFGPNGDGGGQPGFAAVGINSTGTYISPVAQVLSMFGGWLAEPAATMEGVRLPANAPQMPMTLGRAGLGPAPLSCVSAAAVCGAVKRLLAINRCTEVPVSLTGVCGGGTGWTSVEVFNATVSVDGPGKSWVKSGGATPWGPMRPVQSGPGAGRPDAAPLALSVITFG